MSADGRASAPTSDSSERAETLAVGSQTREERPIAQAASRVRTACVVHASVPR